jgi:hypothetical protein
VPKGALSFLPARSLGILNWSLFRERGRLAALGPLESLNFVAQLSVLPLEFPHQGDQLLSAELVDCRLLGHACSAAGYHNGQNISSTFCSIIFGGGSSCAS